MTKKHTREATVGGGHGVGYAEMLGNIDNETVQEKKWIKLLEDFAEWAADNVDVETEGIGNQIRDLFMGRIPDKEHAKNLTEWFATFLVKKNILLREYLG